VFESHDDMSVLGTVVYVSQLFQGTMLRKCSMQRVITDCMYISHAVKDIATLMSDAGDLPMFHDSQPFDGSSMLDCETLHPKAHAEHRKEMLIWESPERFDDSYVLLNLWRARSRSDDDRGKS
jgi:hypothetical protein